MRSRGGNPSRFSRRHILIGVLCVLVTGAAIAGWQVHRATDTTRIDPIAAPNELALQSGDIIVAGGVSLQSRMVRTLTENNRYSHVGMIEVSAQGVYVIHAAPQGEGDGGLGGKVARIPLTLFLAERGYVAVRVMRLSGEFAAGKQIADDACDIARAYVEQAVPFDASFDLSEHDAMYCSELIYLAYQQAGFDWPDHLVTSVSTMIVDGPIILPDAFAKCDGFETVWQYE